MHRYTNTTKRLKEDNAALQLVKDDLAEQYPGRVLHFRTAYTDLREVAQGEQQAIPRITLLAYSTL